LLWMSVLAIEICVAFIFPGHGERSCRLYGRTRL
jgi:hypothetical protein